MLGSSQPSISSYELGLSLTSPGLPFPHLENQKGSTCYSPHRVHTGPNGLIDEKYMKWSIKLLSYRLGFFIILLNLHPVEKNFILWASRFFGWSNNQMDTRQMACMHAQALSCVQLFAAPWTAACPDSFVHGISQARVLEWVVVPSPGDPLNPGIEPMSPASPPLAGRFFTTKPLGKPLRQMNRSKTSVITYIQGSHTNIRAWDLPLWSSGEESTFQCRQFRFHPWSGN